MRLLARHAGETPTLYSRLRSGAQAHGMVGVARRLEGHLGEGSDVEHVDDVRAHGVERALEASAGDHRRDVIGDRLRLSSARRHP